MNEWKVGIVGLSRGRGFVRVFAAHPRVKVTALCDLDEKKLADLGGAFSLPDGALYTDFDTFLGADMDIVVIATPIAFHAEHTIKAIQSGRHVLCEQTAAYTVEDCARIVEVVESSDKHYMMAENYCYFHYIRQWKKDLVDTGRLGRIHYAEAEYIHEIQRLLINAETGAYYWRHQRPPIWYCAHCLGPILMLMDDRIVQACGSAGDHLVRPDQRQHLGFIDMEVGLFRTQKGALIKILRSQVAYREPHLVWYSLYGTNGVVESGRDMKDGLLYIKGEATEKEKNRLQPVPCSVVDPNAPEEAKQGGHGTSEYYLIRDFLDALDANRKPPIDVVRSMDFTVPGIIAHASAMSDGNWRDVPVFV